MVSPPGVHDAGHASPRGMNWLEEKRYSEISEHYSIYQSQDSVLVASIGQIKDPSQGESALSAMHVTWHDITLHYINQDYRQSFRQQDKVYRGHSPTWPSAHWKAFRMRSVSSTDRPTASSLIWILRIMPSGSIMNNPRRAKGKGKVQLLKIICQW